MRPTKKITGKCDHCGMEIEFPAEQIGLVAACPYCQQQTELMLATPAPEPIISRRAWVWSGVAALVLLLGLGGMFYGLKRAERWAAINKPAQTASATGADSATVPAGFEISEITLEHVPGTNGLSAVGTVNNTLDKTRNGVAVRIDLFDADGKKLGTTTAMKERLEPLGQWRFQQPLGMPNAASAKIADVTERQ